jgi:hypothetical protein
VSATLIEDSVVSQLRDRLRLDDTRAELHIPDPELPAFLQGDRTALVQALIEKIEYDRTTGGVAIHLRAVEEEALIAVP